MDWTKEQKQAIEKNGSNILVSAAAGSGKTAVLVERILNKIINQKVDIDQLLVVTFTNASASEMKEKILKALYEQIDKNPNEANLQKQITLLNQAHISTIHAFCLDVIRNNFYELGISANFRVADETEIEIMKQEIMEEIFENKYEEHDKKFLDLLEKYTTYKDDTPLKEIILKLYNFLCSVPFQNQWINQAIEDFNLKEKDFAKTKWGKIIFDYTKERIDNYILNLESAKNLLNENQNLIDNYNIISNDITNFKALTFDTWDRTYEQLNALKFEKWAGKTKISEEEKELKEQAKNIRDEVKTGFEKTILKLYKYNSQEEFEDINEMHETLLNLQTILNEFKERFTKSKTEKNIIDFSDIEHLALKLLLTEDMQKTELAKQYEFNEILIDEYQDSNLIQELILNSVSNGKNIFMVGDVKQSIYRFRQARPDLFLNKYSKYEKAETDEAKINEDTKILLHKNFRSDKSVIDFVNIVFQDIMSEKLGEINYNESEYLNQGKEEKETEYNKSTEIYVIEKNEESKIEEVDTRDTIQIEAKFIASKIKELKEKNVNYKEIAILLRSVSNSAPIFEKELMEAGIPVYSDTATDYLQSIEIDTIISMLKVIDNPLQDIPLVTVLRSPIGGFDDNDLIEIRLQLKDAPFYYSLKQYIENEENKNNAELYSKSTYIFNMISKYQKLEKQIPLNELIWNIYTETGYYYYVCMMPNGKLRQANLRKLFEKAKDYEKISLKGLYNFITFIEKVETKKSNNMSEAKIIGENEDVVRIMSIHKSKGLEFPIVFIANAGKKFNMQDMKEKIIFDQDLGIGLNYIGNQIEYPTLTKEAINLKMKKESISEEMRILYVALTRAKNKLVVVGSAKDAEKNLHQKSIDIAKYHGRDRDEKINSNLVAKYSSYLDWIELVFKYIAKHEDVKLQIVSKNEIPNVEDIEINQTNLSQFEGEIDKQKYDEVDKTINWKYQFLDSINEPGKTSVSTLKNIAIEEKNGEIYVKPNSFIKENINYDFELNSEILNSNDNEKLTPTQKGTLVHLVLQKLNNTNIEETIENLKILQSEKDYLKNNKTIFENYINSDLYKELSQAKEVKKETPFYLNINIENSNQKILVQGVIDLYFINKDDELILVDYKTDRNVKDIDLVNRYKNQLTLYKVALQKALQRKVVKQCIYSTELNKLIEIK